MRFLDKYSAIYNLLICRLAAILDLYVIGYLYGQNDLTNESLDRKLVEKLVLVWIFEQIVQNTFFSICRLATIFNNARSRVMPAGQMSTLVIFIGDQSPYMKPLRNFGYIKMCTGLWSKDRTI